jgi:tetratricopeptide (TPR) repeat protein
MRLVPRLDETAMQRRIVDAQRDKTNLQARIDLAWACVQRQNPVDAGRWLGEVLRAAPDHGQALLVRAALLRQRNEPEAAIDHYRRGFAAGADDFDSRIALGRLLLQAKDADGAIEQWQRAKACWPACTEQENAPELLLAALYRDRGDRTQAQMEMKSYCRRSGRAYTPRYTLAEFEREGGNRNEEARLLVECNRIDPFHARPARAPGRSVRSARQDGAGGARVQRSPRPSGRRKTAGTCRRAPNGRRPMPGGEGRTGRPVVARREVAPRTRAMPNARSSSSSASARRRSAARSSRSRRPRCRSGEASDRALRVVPPP